MSVIKKFVGSHFKFAVLTWHRVVPKGCGSRLGAHTAAGIVTEWPTFLSQLDALQRAATVISLAEAVSGVSRGKVPPMAVVLTFDDGFAEHIELVVPELIRREMAATLFVCGSSLTSAIGLRWLEWCDLIAAASRRQRGYALVAGLKHELRAMGVAEREQMLSALSFRFGVLESERRTLQRNLFASVQQLLAVRDLDLISVGGHSLSHSSLADLEPGEKKNEIKRCRSLLAGFGLTYKPAFAFPFGGVESYDLDCIRLVAKSGFMCACTSIPGYNSELTSQFELRRFDMNRFEVEEVLEGLR